MFCRVSGRQASPMFLHTISYGCALLGSSKQSTLHHIDITALGMDGRGSPASNGVCTFAAQYVLLCLQARPRGFGNATET